MSRCLKPEKGVMAIDALLTSAIEAAIVIQIRCLSFFRAMSSKFADIETRRVFGQMAGEMAEHLESFCSLYQGSDQELVAIVGRNSIYYDPYFCLLLNSEDNRETALHSLRTALKEEQDCIGLYSLCAETAREPDMQDVIVRILDETYKQSEVLLGEYSRLKDMNGSNWKSLHTNKRRKTRAGKSHHH